MRTRSFRSAFAPVALRWALSVAATTTGCSGAIGDGGQPGGGTGAPGPSSGPSGPAAPTPPGPATTVPSGAPSLTDAVDPAPSPMRRLTTVEYARTVADLFAVPADINTTVNLPDDPRVHGFDNDSDLELISLAHAASYNQAAELVAAQVLATPAKLTAVVGCDPSTSATCLQTFVQSFGRRVYRRPLRPAEVSAYLATAAAAGTATPNAGLGAVLQSMLLSPHFLFRVEVGVADAKRPGLLRLNGFEVATRLSYFLLGTTPDDALLDAAQRGDLDTSAGVQAAAVKMLADARAKTSLARFSTQWLQLDLFGQNPPDKTVFKKWSTAIAAAMQEETNRFVDSVTWTDGASFLDLLGGRYTFANTALAAFYGLPAITGTGWQRVDFAADVPRVGLLTQGTLLTLTSRPTRVSTTRRGEYIRETLLCQDIPQPLPGVATEPPPAQPNESERQQFARHTTDPICAGCHTLMDPVGWGLSQFDGIGAIRTTDAQGQPIDASGRLDGFPNPGFTGVQDLAAHLRDSNQFVGCVARSLYRFANGRTETDADGAAVAQLQRAFVESKFDIRKAVVALTGADPFRYRRLPSATVGGMN